MWDFIPDKQCSLRQVAAALFACNEIRDAMGLESPSAESAYYSELAALGYEIPDEV